jgi:hypothetical protein
LGANAHAIPRRRGLAFRDADLPRCTAADRGRSARGTGAAPRALKLDSPVADA